MRLGEIGAIRNMDVDLAAGFNADVREILERKKYLPQNQAIFNIHMNTIKFFSRTCRWAGVKEIHFHSLRHTCLTNLANGYGMEKALPLPKVQQIAGHSDIQTTMRYVHNDIITDTASLQWSRIDRKKKVEEVKAEVLPLPAESPPIKKGLRLVVS